MLNLSRVPLRKKKEQPATQPLSAADSTIQTTTKRQRRRRRHKDLISSLPIPSFAHDSSLELKRMEREFLGEESSLENEEEQEVDLMKIVSKPPISSDFLCDDVDDDDDDDILALPVFQTKRKKKCTTTIDNATDSLVVPAASTQSHPCCTETTFTATNDETTKAQASSSSLSTTKRPAATESNLNEAFWHPLVDDLYSSESDDKHGTIKSFYKNLEARIGKKLTKACKRIVRDRLSDLINNHAVVPQVVQPRPTEFSNDGAATLNHQALDQNMESPSHKPPNNQKKPVTTRNPPEKATVHLPVQLETVTIVGTAPDTADMCIVSEQQTTPVLPLNENDSAQQRLPEEGTKPRKRTRRTAAKAVVRNKIEVAQNSTSTTNKSKKRARRGTCALCTTCSCQKPQNETAAAAATATLELKTFARSDAAIEKALIRRLLKVEKSAENLESQTDMVRRKLKKHRRDVQRKRMKTLPDRSGSKAYFLPDAQEYEAALDQQGTKVPGEIVHQAQYRIFPSVPSKCCVAVFVRVLLSLPLITCHTEGQPTLTQLGFPCPISKANSSGAVTVVERTEASTSRLSDIMEVDEPMEAETCLDNEAATDGALVEPTEEEGESKPEAIDQIHRFHWRKGVKSDSQEGDCIQSQSVWGAVATIQEDQKDDFLFDLSQDIGTAIECPWDRLFSDSTTMTKEVDEGGIEQLLHLLEGGPASISSQMMLPSNKENDPPNTNSADLSMQLSQGGKEAANQVYSAIDGDVAKTAALNRVCQNWKENVAYAFVQKDKGEIEDALGNLRKSRAKMMDTKRKILEAWGRHHVALDVLETTLEASLGRLKSHGASSPKKLEDAGTEERFQSQLLASQPE